MKKEEFKQRALGDYKYGSNDERNEKNQKVELQMFPECKNIYIYF